MENLANARILCTVVLLILQSHHSLCYLSPCTSTAALSCPAVSVTSEDRIEETTLGSGEQLNQTNVTANINEPAEHKYFMETSIGLGADTSVIEITLRFAKCIPFNPAAMAGPRWFKLEAISNNTRETVGEFTTPPFHTEAELCKNNVIAFRTTNPTVLDMPRTYRWKPTSTVQESVCFRATITHYPDNTCETITKCLPSSEIPTAAPLSSKVDNSAINFPSKVVIVPSDETIRQCNKQWNCEHPKWRSNPHCVCNTETKKCKQFSMKCQARREMCYYKNNKQLPLKLQKECDIEPTTPPLPTTSPPPTAPPVKGFCKLQGSKMTCSSTGDFKLSQCLPYSDTQYECFCSSYVGEQYVFTKQFIEIGACGSPTFYDLNCIYD